MSAAAVAALAVAVNAQTPDQHGAADQRAASASGSAARDISGIWKLNPELSDKAPAAPAPNTPGEEGDRPGGRGGRGGYGGPGGGGRGGFGGGMRGGGMGGPRGGMQRDPEQMKRMRDFMQAVMTAPAGVTIVQHDNEITFTDDQGQVTKLACDGKDEKHVFGSETGKTKTKWNGNDLVMEISPTGDGPKVTRTYTLVQGPDGAKQLRIVSKLEGRGARERTITHVYEPATPN